MIAHAKVLPSAAETVSIFCQHCGQSHRLRAFADDPRLHSLIPRPLGRRIDRFSALALIAVTELVQRSVGLDPARVGVFVANSTAGWSYGLEQLERLVTGGIGIMQAYQATAWFPAAAQGEVTILWSITGEAKTLAGGRGALGQAWWAARDALECGVIDHAIVVAAESRVSAFSMVTVSPCEGTGDAGTVLGEGAVAFLSCRPGRDDSPAGLALEVSWCREEPEAISDPLARAVQAARALDLGELPVSLGDGYVLIAARNNAADNNGLRSI